MIGANRNTLIFLTGLLVICLMFYFIGGVILPFILGLGGAFLANSFLNKFTKHLPNRSLRVSIFLVSFFSVAVSSVLIFGHLLINDIERLNTAFTIFAENNSDQIDATTSAAKDYLEIIYPKVEAEINSLESNPEETEKMLANVFSFFSSGSNGESSHSINWIYTFVFSIIYFIYILFTFPYFESKFDKYVDPEDNNDLISIMVKDFFKTFSNFFRQRFKVVVFSAFICIIGFLIIGIPGAITLGILAGVLCFISHFQYIALLPLAICCWAFSVEQETNFFVILGLVTLVLIIVSVCEELIFFPKIMKEANSMNPAILMISVAIWTYLLGFVGSVLAIPLTSFILIYIDKLLLKRKGSISEQQICETTDL
jgi:predicted PurR-regulated permease PerM